MRFNGILCEFDVRGSVSAAQVVGPDQARIPNLFIPSPWLYNGMNRMLNDSKGVGLYKPGYVSPYAENMMAIDENDKVAHAPLPFKTGTMNY